jgi:hypothetical protein
MHRGSRRRRRRVSRWKQKAISLQRHRRTLQSRGADVQNSMCRQPLASGTSSERQFALSCSPNWAVKALLPRHALLHCLIIPKPTHTRASLRSAWMLGIVVCRSNTALMRHTVLRAHRRRGGVGAHVRIGIAGPHPQTIWRGRGRPPHRQDIVLPAALGLHQNSLRSRGSSTVELDLTAPSAR